MFDTERIWQQCWEQIGERHGIKLGLDFRREVGGSNGEHMRMVTRKYFNREDVDEIINLANENAIRLFKLNIEEKNV